MIAGFSGISDNQFETLKEAIAWITALIAGADGAIDTKETEWAKKLADIRSYANPNDLTPFYEEVGKDFSVQLDKLIEHLPESKEARMSLLERKIAQLNDILPLLPNATGAALYASYVSFANHVAKASGGFLGFFSVSSEESKLIELPMLDKIELEEEEEE